MQKKKKANLRKTINRLQLASDTVLYAEGNQRFYLSFGRKTRRQRFKHTSGLSISVRFSKNFIAHRKIIIDSAKTLFYLAPGNIFVLFLQSPHQEFTRAVNVTAPCHSSKTVQRDLEKRSAISTERQ